MGAVGGSIQSVSIQGRSFAVASDADANIKLGGFETESRSNGDGSARDILTRVIWSVTNLVLILNPILGDQEYLQGVADNVDQLEGYDFTITLANKSVFQAKGKLQGELSFSTQNTSATVSFGGGGKVTRQ